MFVFVFFCFTHIDGLNSTAADNLLGTNVKQEPLSDDECNSEDGYGYDGNHDEFDEEDTFNHSTINILQNNSSQFIEFKIQFKRFIHFQVIMKAVIMNTMKITTSMTTLNQKATDVNIGNEKHIQT